MKYFILLWSLRQFSANPTAYTKLHCYLPWIAKQYGLEYEQTEIPKECYTSTGDINDIADANTCANKPSNIQEEFEGLELPCIFPYHLNGVKYDSCQQFSIDEFVIPINRCPIRNITTKFDGYNSYTADKLPDLLDSYSICEESEKDPNDFLPALDPDRGQCGLYESGGPFSRCKNNCNKGIVLTLFNYP